MGIALEITDSIFPDSLYAGKITDMLGFSKNKGMAKKYNRGIDTREKMNRVSFETMLNHKFITVRLSMFCKE